MRICNPFPILAVALSLFASNLFAFQFEAGDVDTLIAQLDNPNSRKREDAAESLSQTVKPKKISPAIRQRLTKENDFHVKLALHYALASQGEKESLSFLIDSLQESGHMGANYLRYTIGQDFGWNVGEYREWYTKTSAKEFRDFINERWRRKPMRDEYAEFSSLYFKQTIGGMTSVETGELVGPEHHLTDADKIRLAELPTAKSWRIFTSALTALDDEGDRKKASALFHKIVDEYPDTSFADQSRELSKLLDEMIVEDEKFVLPSDFEKLPQDKQIAVHIHLLRDARAHQFSQPGSCQLSFHGSNTPETEDYNPALALYEIGDPAADALSDYYDDRRPIRGVGYWRNFHPSRSVLRYGDAADQIIKRIN